MLMNTTYNVRYLNKGSFVDNLKNVNQIKGLLQNTPFDFVLL